MPDWSTPTDRLQTLNTPAKPARNWVWWTNTTVVSCAVIAVACLILAIVIGAL